MAAVSVGIDGCWQDVCGGCGLFAVETVGRLAHARGCVRVLEGLPDRTNAASKAQSTVKRGIEPEWILAAY